LPPAPKIFVPNACNIKLFDILHFLLQRTGWPVPIQGLSNMIHTDHFANLEDAAAFEQKPQAQTTMRGQLATAIDAKAYMSAGKATITLVSKATGNRFTYRLSLSEDKGCIFVNALVGPDNTADYKYIGRIARDIFWAGRKIPKSGDVSRDAPCVKAFDWAWRQLMRGALPAELEIWHEGQCGRCGRKLTVPSSVAQGFGPECATKIDF
jgi:Family of unknown function (DUF6011)